MRLRELTEKRREPRAHRCESIRWRRLGGMTPTAGWLLDAATNGCAVACRTGASIAPGTILEIRGLDRAATEAVAHAVVRRSVDVHDDLRVLGAELTTISPFPPAAHAYRCHSELKPCAWLTSEASLGMAASAA